MEGAKAVLAQGGAVAEAELEALGAAVEKAEQMVALEAVAVAVALEAVADWEAETEREETLLMIFVLVPMPGHMMLRWAMPPASALGHANCACGRGG